MGFYEWGWWKRIFQRTEEKKKADTLKDLEAIQEFLKSLPADAKALRPDFEELEELERERLVARSSLLKTNFDTQAAVLEKIMQRYEYLQNDVDINGIRVKLIAQEFLNQVQKAGFKEMLAEKKKSPKWKLAW